MEAPQGNQCDCNHRHGEAHGVGVGNLGPREPIHPPREQRRIEVLMNR